MKAKRTYWGFGIVLIAVFGSVATGWAQENVRWGPFRMTLGFTAGMEFDDNVNASETQPKADVKVRVGPTLTGGVFIPFAGGEQFTLSLSATYNRSLTDVNSESFGSPLAATLLLPLYVNHWSIVASDSFTFSNEPLESTFAFNRGKAEQFANFAGVSASREFGRIALSFGAQRTDKFAPDDPTTEETVYQLSFTPAYFFRENYSIFWRNSVGITLPSDPTRTDQRGWSSSIGLSGQITPTISGTVSIGYQHSHLLPYTKPGTNGVFGGIFNRTRIPADNIDGISSDLAISYSHPLRPNTAHSLTFFRNPGVTALLTESNVQEAYGAGYTISHRLNPRLTLTPQLTWTHLKDVSQRKDGSSGEEADLIAVGFGLTRRFTDKLTMSFDYKFQTRISNLPLASYDDNHMVLDFSYTF